MEPYINQVTLETFPLYYSIVSLFCIWMLCSSSYIALTCKYYAPTFLFQVISYDLTCLLVVLYAKKFWGWSAIHCHCVPHKVPWPSHGSSSSLLSAPLQSLLYTELLTLFFMWKQILAIKNIGSKSSPLPIRNIYMEWNTRKRFCYMDNFFYNSRLYRFWCNILYRRLTGAYPVD